MPQTTLSQWIAQASLRTLRRECGYKATDTGGTSTLVCIPVFSVQECSVQEFSAGQDLLKCLVNVPKKGNIPADVWFPLTAL